MKSPEPAADPVRLHHIAVATMLLCTLLWSLSGIVTRQLTYAAGLETTFWRSLAAAIAVACWLRFDRGPNWIASIRTMGRIGLLSGLMWAIMFTCFMISIVMTTVAKAIVVLAVTPLLAALLAWLVLNQQIAPRTWGAILVAGIGIIWMVSDALQGDPNYPLSAWGMLVAAGVPLASAANLIVLKRAQTRIDLVPAVLIGAVLSCAVTLPFALPLQAGLQDVAWLSFLGVFQLALPCVLLVWAARTLSPQETALLALLEVVFAPLWVWLGAGERPSDATLWGGALVLSALIGNELLADRRRPPLPLPTLDPMMPHNRPD